jgi:hypothetical protein
MKKILELISEECFDSDWDDTILHGIFTQAWPDFLEWGWEPVVSSDITILGRLLYVLVVVPIVYSIGGTFLILITLLIGVVSIAWTVLCFIFFSLRATFNLLFIRPKKSPR